MAFGVTSYSSFRALQAKNRQPLNYITSSLVKAKKNNNKLPYLMNDYRYADGEQPLSDKLFEGIAKFDAWAKSYRSFWIPQESIFHLKQIENINFFSMILRHSNAQLSGADSLIDDTAISNFFKSISIPEYEISLQKVLKSIANMIIAKKHFDILKLRGMLLMFYMPQLYEPTFSEILGNLVQSIGAFSKVTRTILLKWLPKLPILLSQLVKGCHLAISSGLKNYFQKIGWPSSVISYVDTLAIVFEANKHCLTPVPFSSFINEEMDSRTSMKVYPKFPYVLSFPCRLKVSRIQVKELQTAAEVENMVNGRGERLSLMIHRNNFFEDSVPQLIRLKPFDFYRKLQITFIGESAFDAGGPQREFLRMMTNQLIQSSLQLVNDRFFWFKHADLINYTILGIIIGMAIGNETTLPIRFPTILYSKLLDSHFHPTLNDFAELDPTTAQSLEKISEMATNNEDVSLLELTFDASIECNKTVPINDAMGGVAVTNDNCRWFIREYVNWAVNKNFSKEFEAFKYGFKISCPSTYLAMYTATELDKIVSGEEVYDWDAMKEVAAYKDGLTANSDRIRWFWTVFDEMTDEMKMSFLRFTTGMDRAPFGGMKKMKIRFRDGGCAQKLPISHTCFNMFFLPDYCSKEQLKEKVYLVLQYTEGFGLM